MQFLYKQKLENHAIFEKKKKHYLNFGFYLPTEKKIGRGGVAPQHIFDKINTIDNTMTIGMTVLCEVTRDQSDKFHDFKVL